MEVFSLERRAFRLPAVHGAHVHDQLHLRPRGLRPRRGHPRVHPPLQRGDGLGLGAARPALQAGDALAHGHRHEGAPRRGLDAPDPHGLPAAGGGGRQDARGRGRGQRRGAHALRHALLGGAAAQGAGPRHRRGGHPPAGERDHERPQHRRLRRVGEALHELPLQAPGPPGLPHDGDGSQPHRRQGLCHPVRRPGPARTQHGAHGLALVVEEGPAAARARLRVRGEPVHAAQEGRSPRTQPQGLPHGRRAPGAGLHRRVVDQARRRPAAPALPPFKEAPPLAPLPAAAAPHHRVGHQPRAHQGARPPPAQHHQHLRYRGGGDPRGLNQPAALHAELGHAPAQPGGGGQGQERKPRHGRADHREPRAPPRRGRGAAHRHDGRPPQHLGSRALPRRPEPGALQPCQRGGHARRRRRFGRRRRAPLQHQRPQPGAPRPGQLPQGQKHRQPRAIGRGLGLGAARRRPTKGAPPEALLLGAAAEPTAASSGGHPQSGTGRDRSGSGAGFGRSRAGHHPEALGRAQCPQARAPAKPPAAGAHRDPGGRAPDAPAPVPYGRPHAPVRGGAPDRAPTFHRPPWARRGQGCGTLPHLRAVRQRGQAGRRVLHVGRDPRDHPVPIRALGARHHQPARPP
mmetsp:Transcript_19310/g.56915  ORF Transcript_19310/g.56915 Transcript_19310/m.56915 type:complete len:629 (-) Transcript_19310:280-2166(-)